MKNERVLNMAALVGWALVASGATIVVVKALTDIGLL
jgi:hypothetical protein